MHYIDIDTGERLPIYEPEWKVEPNRWKSKEGGSIMIKSKNAASTSKEKEEEQREIVCSKKDLSAKMFQNPPGFTTELSSNPSLWKKK